jgi:hypothetical protein
LSDNKQKNTVAVPKGLRRWFVVHFIVDIIAAIPLFFLPETVLAAFSWPRIDPFATRLVAAAFFGIGIESLLARNGSSQAFHSMLNLKIIWSSFAVAGITFTMFSQNLYINNLAWTIFFIFLFFLFLWIYWKLFLILRN